MKCLEIVHHPIYFLDILFIYLWYVLVSLFYFIYHLITIVILSHYVLASF